ncbi:MAG: 50S ribosomal protein L3 [bacterium]
MKFLIGRKMGMTQIFDDSGQCLPVTIVQAGPCYVVQVKTIETDGYNAVKLGFGEWRKEKNQTKAFKGQFTKNNIKVLSCVKEFRVDNVNDFKVGQEIKADVFNKTDYVDVTGVSKGKGFQGVVKRWGFAGAPSSHGHTEYRRAPGSIGASSFPSRVLKGIKMPGRMGGGNITQQKVEVAYVNPEENLVLIKGSVPGNVLGKLYISTTVKSKKKFVEKKHPEQEQQEANAAAVKARKKEKEKVKK